MKKSLDIQLQNLFWKIFTGVWELIRELDTQFLLKFCGDGMYLSALETSDQPIYITLIFVFL